MTLPGRSGHRLQWPGGHAVSVSMTFDVDAESALLGMGLEEAKKYSAFTERRFGVVRGLPRILAWMAAQGIKGTFYVPGYTAQRYPDEVRSIVEGGHEVAHHGFLHRPPNLLDDAGLREEMERGIEALRQVTGKAPVGYRSPSWEVTEETFSLLGQLHFEWDSSCMGDDWPYVEQLGSTSLVELPVHWSLDDFPYYSWRESGGGLMADPGTVGAIWLSEFKGALREGGHVTYTAHPEISGRRARFEALQRLVDTIRSSADVWFATHGEVAQLVRANA